MIIPVLLRRSSKSLKAEPSEFMNRSVQFRYIVFCIVVILLAIYVIFVRQYDSITSLQAAYATLIIILGVLPWLVVLKGKREAGLIPLMPLHGLFYVFSFGLPVLSNKTVWLASREDEITDALVLTIFGLICLYIGYYSFRKFYVRLKPLPARNVSLHQQIRAAWIFFGLFLSFKFFPVLKTLPSVEQLSAPLGYLSLGILALLAFDKRLPRAHLVLFFVAVPFTLVITALSGSLATTVFFLIFFGVLYWNKKRRIPWHFFIISALVAIVLNPVKLNYRDVVWYDEGHSSSYFDKGKVMGSVLQDYYSGTDIFSSVSEDTSTINRLAHISTFGLVISMTPDLVPYWAGESYHTLWTSFVPRVIWPDKPKSNIGQDFGHRYDFIGVGDYWTSINLPWLIEFYANFGMLGVLVGMFLVGLFFRILVQKFKVPVSSPMEHVLAVTVMFGLFYAESNLALMIGGVIPVYIAFFVLLRLMTRGQHAKAPCAERSSVLQRSHLK